MLHRLLVVGLLITLAGCARNTRPDGEPLTPRYEHIFPVPLEQALAEARKLLEEKGQTFEATGDEGLLLSSWQVPQGTGQSPGSEVRYIVSGIRVTARHSVVRIFRMNRREVSAVALTDRHGPLSGPREVELEKELAQRLASVASSEPAGNAVAFESPPQLFRDDDFYLQRWMKDETAPGPDADSCRPMIRGFKDLLQPDLTLLIGEQLGSQEAPRAVGNMACEAAASGYEVALGLSIPAGEQKRVNHYLASPGAPADQEELLEGFFWRRPYQDGRSSQAVVDLLDRVRSWRAWGLPIHVVAYDTAYGNGDMRYARQAEIWQQRRKARPGELFLILAGNVHVRTVQGAPWDPDFQPLGWRLASSGFHPLALNLSYSKGSRRWGCDVDNLGSLYCEIVSSNPSDRVSERAGLSPYIRLFQQPNADGYHGLFYVGILMPSNPATSKERDRDPLPKWPTSVPRR